MTNSAISTEPAGGPGISLPERFVAPVAIGAGWLLILFAYRWHITPSSAFLAMAWASLVATAKVMWSSFFAAATEVERAELSAFELGQTRRGDLLREKRALLRAIKDAEFDRDMGKMSDDEAGQIIRVYRSRAIEVIRELEDGPAEAAELPPDQLIERELASRLGESVPRAPTGAGDRRPAGPKPSAAPAGSEPDDAPASAEPGACDACGTDNDPDAVFCKKCGARMAEAQS